MIEPMEKVPDEPCDVCHRDPSADPAKGGCICPECRVCGVVGDPKCWADHFPKPAPPPEAVKGGAAAAIEKAAREYVAARRKAGAVRFGPGNAEDAFDADAAEDAAWTNLCVAVDGWAPTQAEAVPARYIMPTDHGPVDVSYPSGLGNARAAQYLRDAAARIESGPAIVDRQAEAVKADPGAPSYFEPAEGVCACCRQVKLWHGPKGECPAPFPAMVWPGAPAALPTGAPAKDPADLWELLQAYSDSHDLALKGSCRCRLCELFGDLDWNRRPEFAERVPPLEAHEFPVAPTGADPRDLEAAKLAMKAAFKAGCAYNGQGSWHEGYDQWPDRAAYEAAIAVANPGKDGEPSASLREPKTALEEQAQALVGAVKFYRRMCRDHGLTSKEATKSAGWMEHVANATDWQITEARSAPKPSSAEGSPSSLPAPSPGETALDLEAIELFISRAISEDDWSFDVMKEGKALLAQFDRLRSTPGAQESRPLIPAACYRCGYPKSKHRDMVCPIIDADTDTEPQTLSEGGATA